MVCVLTDRLMTSTLLATSRMGGRTNSKHRHLIPEQKSNEPIRAEQDALGQLILPLVQPDCQFQNTKYLINEVDLSRNLFK